jgi:rod shape-determining protein MreD
MAKLVIIPAFILVFMIQMIMISNLPLIHGTADLIFLIIIAWSLKEHAKNAIWIAGLTGLAMDYISATPFGTYIISYIIIVSLARLLQNKIWQAPVLSMLFMTVIGTIFCQSVTYAMLFLRGVTLPLTESITQVILPGLLLNLLLMLPVYLIVSDFSSWIFPVKDLV